MYVTKEMNAEFVKNWKTPLIYIQAEPGNCNYSVPSATLGTAKKRWY